MNHHGRSLTPLALLYRGEASRVLLAQVENQQRQEVVILKTVFVNQDPTLRQKAIDELRVLSFLTAHRQRAPFVVRYHFAQQQQQRAISLGLEFCPGGDLHGLLYSPHMAPVLQGLTLLDLLLYLAEISAALQQIHRLGVYHGDLKPSNVFISRSGHLKIGDFGESKVMSRPGEQMVTHSGTPPYCAPEILFRRPHGFEPDWWSLGVMVCELTTGATPFSHLDSDRAAFEAICYADIHGLLARLPFPTPDVRALATGLLRRDLASRVGDADVETQEVFRKVLRWGDVVAGKYLPPFVPVQRSPDDAYYLTGRSNDQREASVMRTGHAGGSSKVNHHHHQEKEVGQTG